MIHKVSPSFFEITVAMAFWYFNQKSADISIIEVGLGGRLDSTNVIEPELSVITNIGWDHMQFLGNTLPEIAREKAGIIKAGIPIITGETKPECLEIFKSVAHHKNAPLFSNSSADPDAFDLNPKRRIQRENQKTVLKAIEILRTQGWNINSTHIAQGLRRVTKNTGLRGRWEMVHHDPMVLCDTAHNWDGIRQLVSELKKVPHTNLHLVLGMVSDKDAGSILGLFPQEAKYYITEPSIPRKMPKEELAKILNLRNIDNYSIHDTVPLALKNALKNSESEDLIFVGGSTFIVADLLVFLEDDTLESLLDR